MRAISLFVLLIALSACNSSAPESQGNTAEGSKQSQSHTISSNSASKKANNATLAQGAKIYAMYCGSCHGSDGQAGVSGAKNLALSELEKNEVKEVIRKGSENKKMMAYGNLLDDDEIEALAKYVMEFRKQ